MDWLRSCYRGVWNFPGAGEIEGYFFFNDEAPLWEGENYFVSSNYHKGDRTPWREYGEMDAPQPWKNGSFPIVKPEARTVGPLDQIAGDAPIDPPTRPALFGLPLLCWSTEVSITVKEKDNDPTYTGVAVLSFDQDDGFEVSQPSSFEAQINLKDASYSQKGAVSTEDQTFSGVKRFAKHVEIAHSSDGKALVFKDVSEVEVLFIEPDWSSSSSGAYIRAVTYSPTNSSIELHLGYQESGGPGRGCLLRLENYTPDYAVSYFGVTDSIGNEFLGATVVVNGQTFAGGLYISGTVTVPAADVTGLAAAIIAVGDARYVQLVNAYTDTKARNAVGLILVDSADFAFTYNAGTPSITAVLTASGVTAGTYPKVTVDTKGRVTAGLALVTGDLPDFDGFTSATLADGDMFPFSDVSAVANKKVSALALRSYLVPPGTVMDYAGSSLPSGWLNCDGAAVSRSTYADLFSAIGTTWGAGNGSTTFNVPDLRGRTVVGVGTGSGLSPRNIAGSGGTETHTLSTGEIPSHSHTPGLGTRFLVRNDGASSYAVSTAGANIDTENCSATSNTGGGGSHNNMQPFANLYHIIKT